MLLDISVSRPAPKKNAPERFPPGHIFRRFDDGSVEMQTERNVRIRTRLYVCDECECEKPQQCFSEHFDFDSFQPLIAKICGDCERVNQRRERMSRMLAARQQAVISARTAARRRATLVAAASPSWRDRDAIRSIYAEAQRLSRETDVPHDVDHIHPIQGVFSCGLHVHWNLRVMRASENRSKGADFDVSDEPAWAGMEWDDIVAAYQQMAREYNARFARS